MTELIFGTYNNWQAALVCDARAVVAGFYDSLARPNLNGAIATARITEVHPYRAYVDLPDGDYGFIEGKNLPPEGSLVVVRITGYVPPPSGPEKPGRGKAWPLRLAEEDRPAAAVQWHDAAVSVIDHATAYYAVPQSAMRQDDDFIADFLHHHNGREELAHGATVMVEHTTALTTFDLNTGRLHGVANWIAAFAPAIANGLRHYNIGGPVVVEAGFLGMQARKGLADKLKSLIADDPIKTELIGTTRMGLIELTRMRTGPSRLQVPL